MRCPSTSHGYASAVSDQLPDLLARLDGLDYPVSKEDLIRRAQEMGVDTETLSALRALPVTQLDSPTELARMVTQAGGGWPAGGKPRPRPRPRTGCATTTRAVAHRLRHGDAGGRAPAGRAPELSAVREA